MKLASSVLVMVVLALGWFLLSCRTAPAPAPAPAPTPGGDGEALDYDQLVHLDAEALAEGGIGEAYSELGPVLRARGVEPAPVEELEDETGTSYTVRCRGVTFPIYRDPNDEESWGSATHAFFSIVNEQLPAAGPRFYAINSGNDLGGLFLTDDEVTRARAALPRRTDWPYLPTKDAPHYGQPH